MRIDPRNFRKAIAGILLICLLGFVSLGVFVPKSAHAMVVTDPSLLGKNIAQWVKQGWEKFRDNALALAYKNLLGTFLQQMAYDAATFIASGGEGQESLVYSKPAGEYFKDLNDAALGAAVEGFAEGMGFSQSLCTPPDDLLQIDIAYGLMTQFGSAPPPGPACTLSEMGENWSEAFADPEFDTFINLYYDPQANNLGTALATTTHVMEQMAIETEDAKWDRLYSGGEYRPVVESVSGWIQTPASMIKTEMEIPLESEKQKWGQYTGSILADTAGVFLNTLTSKLLQRMTEGMFNTVSGSSLASLMAGSTGGQVAGVTAAEEVYASLNKPSFIATGVYNVMNDFITCPPDPEQATIYNCVIGSSLQSAIDSRWTVQEFVDYLNDNGVTFKFAQEDISSPEEGLSVRAITILKKFRVVPVGWQIAAEYVNSEVRVGLDEQSEYTLPQVMELYDNCDSDQSNADTAYSPLCKLVDPYWVLKAPENYCARESWTSDILYESFSDTDANPNTQEIREVTRDTACVDERACIRENADGSCSAYGYCTEERRTYKFEGEACESQYSSCQSFLDEDGEVVSYLKNTVNQDDCATNPGCKWYCQYTDTIGNFLCVDEDTVYETCQDGAAGYSSSEFCDCEKIETCEVVNINDCNINQYPDCARTCAIGTETCELDDNCGADYPTYDHATETCTCTLTNECQVGLGGSTCAVATGSTCDIGTPCSEDSNSYEKIESCACADPNDPANTCDIGLGDYYCDLPTGGQCYFPTTTEQPAVDDPDAPGFVWDIAVNFDNDLEECGEDAASCELFYRVIPGANILPNAQFSYFSGTPSDNAGDAAGFCSENGNACTGDSTGCDCLGWINPVSGQVVDSSYGSDIIPQNGDYAFLLPAGSDAITNSFDTGRSLDNRTFTIGLRAAGPDDDCVFTYRLRDGAGTYVDEKTDNLDSNPGSWAEFTHTVTFPDAGLGNELAIEIDQCPNTRVGLDVVSVEESAGFAGFSDYGANSASYLKQDDLLECGMDDVGCELYAPAIGRDEDAVPALITNPDSDICVDPAYLPYQNPGCSQCPESEVGCDFYQEQPLVNLTPLTDPTLSATADRAGVIERTGHYCVDDMTRSCYDSSDCGGSACVPDISLIPSTGTACSASQVGCEEYTNLDEVAAGGEGLEYYSYIRQCVTPEDEDRKTFYTWVGSDVAGYQLQSYLLKAAGDADNSPCTMLDPSSTDFDADCYNDVVPANDCSAEFGVDPDCRQYYDADGKVFYRYESEVIYVSEECTPLRNSLDDNVYYSVPAQSTACSAANVGCREYRGTDAGNVEYLIDADFSSNTTAGWNNAESTSSEAIVQGDYSLSLTTSNPPVTYDLFLQADGDIFGDLDPGGIYTLSFWAKDPAGGDITAGISGAGQTQYFTPDGSTTNAAEADFLASDDWQYYRVGPVILPDDASVDDGDEFFFIESGDNTAYVDNIQLKKSDSQYLIKASFDTCAGYEGCRAYADRAGGAHYLKSFIRLCREDMVGCEVMLDSYNSANPFTQMWNTDNEFGLDNVLVPRDYPKSYVYTEEAACAESDKGCTMMGLPDIDEQTGEVGSYETLYRLNDPDRYDELLCEEHQLQCEAFTSDFDGTLYFKDPGSRTCEWTQDENGNFGWYKTGTDYEDCTVRYGYVEDSPPIGSICNSNSGSKVGHFCTTDADCSPDDGSADGNTYPPRCISSLSEEVSDTGALGYSDFGWVGLCPEDASGCTTYNDSSSPNVEELVENSGFEDDVRDNTNNTYYEVTTDDPSYESIRDFLPDYWSDPAGACPVENFSESTDEFFSGSKSLHLDDCTVYTADRVPVDRDQLYNLSGWFKGQSEDFDLGLEYYDSNNQLIEVGEEVFATGQNYLPNNGFEDQTTSWDFGNYIGCAKALSSNGYAQSGYYFAYTFSYLPGIGCNVTSGEFSVPSGEILEISAYMTPVGADGDVFLGVSCYNDDSTDYNCAQHFENLPANTWTEVSFTLGPPGSGADYETFLSPMDRIQVRGGSGPGTNPGGLYRVAVDNFSVRTTSSYESFQTSLAARGANIAPDADWTYYYAHVGPGSINEFPEGTASVRAYVGNNSASDLYADDVSFKEVDEYDYLDYTVDGTREHAQATGNSTCTDIDTDEGEINSGGGCVGFQDTLYYTESLHPFLQGECTQCVDGLNDSDCYNLPNACNANSIIKVTPDRVCDKWVACLTARVVEHEDGTSEYTCFSLDQCEGMDEEGRCNEWNNKPAYSELSEETDMTFTSSAGNNTELDLIQNLTGYVKAGLTWPDLLMCQGGVNNGEICETNAECEDKGACEFVPPSGVSHSPTTQITGNMRCVGGSNNGQPCGDPSDCVGTDDGVCSAALKIEGYYPYGWMPEVGEDGVQTGDPLIMGGDFEDLYCAGADADQTMPCILDKEDGSLLPEYGLEEGKGQCWLSEFEDWASTHPDDESGPQFVCPNTPNDIRPEAYQQQGSAWVWPFTGWSGLLGNEDIRIWQYDGAYDPPDDVRVDINNVLQVSPSEGDFASGVKYDLTNKIAQDGEYTLSLKARYTSSPAGNDTVNIGFRHENGEYDYFLKGSGMADIVVVVDNATDLSDGGTYGMTGAIDKMRSDISALKDQLEVAGVDTKIAVVGLGGNGVNTSCQPNDDYCYVGGCPADTDDNYLQEDLTGDIGEVETGLDTINGRAEQDCTNEPYGIWQTLASDLDNPPLFQLGQSFQPSFRNDAKKFFILLTNSAYDSGEYTEAQDLLVESGAPLYVITMDAAVGIPGVNAPISTRNPYEYYQDMANASGGKVYDDLANAWYHNGTSGPLWDIGNLILDRLEIFQFSTELETYTFGPLKVEKKTSPNDTTELVIASSGTAGFQIDNVSLLPTLEVNKSLDTIARTCRAYPAEDAPYCSYTESNGQIYRGWKGYCLELDPENTKRCITWWPLDIIAGEFDLFTKTPAGYSGRSSVYYCQVAKGYADVGFCADSGTLYSLNDPGMGGQCDNDSDCDSGEDCMEGAFYSYGYAGRSTYETFSGSCDVYQSFPCGAWPLGQTDDSDVEVTVDLMDYCGAYFGYCVQPPSGGDKKCVLSITDYEQCADLPDWYWTNQTCSINSDCSYNPNNTCETTACLDNGDPPETGFSYCTENANLADQGFTNTRESCNFSDPIDWSGNYQTTTRKWSMETINHLDLAFGINSGYVMVQPANAIESNINISEIEKIIMYTGSAGGGGDSYKHEKEFWGQTMNGHENQEYWKYAQRPVITDLDLGAVPEGEDADNGPWTHCELLESGMVRGMGCFAWGRADETASLGEPDFYDLYYVYGFSNFERNESYNSTECNVGSSGNVSSQYRWRSMQGEGPNANWLESPCFDAQAKRVVEYEAYGSNNNPFDHLDIDLGSVSTLTYFDYTITDSFYSTTPNWDRYKGGNVLAYYLDFDEEGYLENTYTLVWYGAGHTQDNDFGVDLTYDLPMQMDLYLREPCAVVAEAVDEFGDNTAWAVRATNSEGYPYALPYTWGFNNNPPAVPYASIQPRNEPYSNAPPDEWDSKEPEEGYLGTATALGPQPSFIEETKEFDGGRPYACIGKCDVRVCGGGGDYDDAYEPCDKANDCESGICMGAYESNWDGSGLGYVVGDFDAQRQAAADQGSNVLRHIFANMITWYYFRPADLSETNGAYNIDQNGGLWGAPDNYFVDMPKCTDVNSGLNERPENPGDQAGLPTEYCGVRPVVENVAIDGRTYVYDYYEIDSGQMVELTFDSVVDEEQLPLNWIEINWGDGEDTSDEWRSASGGHIYNHAYTCTPDLDIITDGEDDQFCRFTIDITLLDNWGWCSGSDHSADAGLPASDYRNLEPTKGDIFTGCRSGDYVPFAIGVPE